MFGLSFGELCVLLIVAMVVLGPKELPRYLRKAGQFAGRLRRMAYEMRERSGIDEVLRTEGLDREIAELRKLARGEVGGVMSAFRSANDALRGYPPAVSHYPTDTPAAAAPPVVNGSSPAPPGLGHQTVSREREYPLEGADAGGALPDTAVVYAEAPASAPPAPAIEADEAPVAPAGPVASPPTTTP